MKRTLILTMLVLVWAGCSVQAQVISIALHNGKTTVNAMTPDLVAGVVPVANWNNVDTNNRTIYEVTTPIPLVDDGGAATTTGFTYKVGYSNYNSNGWAAGQGNYIMMEGWFGVRANDNGHYTITGIPYDLYDVYIYYESNNHNRIVQYTLGSQVKYGAEGPLFAGVFTEADGTSYADATVGNYLHFTEVTGADLVILADANTGRAACQAIQIVKSPPRARQKEPLNGATDVLVGSTLQWRAGEDPNNPGQVYPAITGHFVFLGTDEAAVAAAGIDDVSGVYRGFTPAGRESWTPGVDDSAPLVPDVTYYWRVDERLADDANTIPGVIWRFEMEKTLPVIAAGPANVYAFAGETVTLSLTLQPSPSPVTYQWFKGQVGDTSMPVGGEGTVGEDNTASVDIAVGSDPNVAEGYYYCHLVNDAGPTDSQAAYLTLKRLMGWWKFDGVLTNELADGRDGVMPAVPLEYVAGKDGQGLTFIGDGSVVAVTNSADFYNFYPRGYTLSGWIQTTQTDYGCIAAKQYRVGSNAEWRGILINHNGDNAISTLRQIADVSTPAGILDGQWHLITGQYVPWEGRVKLFVDGRLLSQSDPLFVTVETNAEPLVFGAAEATGQYSPLNGVIDDVRIWNYVVDAVDIANLYVAFNPGAQVCLDNPTYDFDGDCVVTLADFAVIAQNWMMCNLIPVEDCQLP